MNNISSLIIFNLFLLFCIVNVSSSEKINCISCEANEKNCTIFPGAINKTVECDLAEENTCYVKLDNDGHNKRGCIKEDDCKEEDNCYTCQQEKCNNKINPLDRPKCHQCNGRVCDDPKKNLTVEYCEFYINTTATENKCFTTNTTFNVIRGCVAGAKKEDLSCDGQTNCKATQCNNVAAKIPCNYEVFNINKCYKCDSKSDSNCATEFTAESYENCKNEAGCYARYKDGVASRGCAENLNDHELTECKKTDNKYCQHCDAPGCNKNKINVPSSEKINCISCEANEKNCTISPKAINKTVECDLAEENTCYVKLDNDGHNKRGCIKEAECKVEEHCYICQQEKCNEDIKPSDRPKCHQCNGRVCDDPQKRNLTVEYCEFYINTTATENKCFTTNTTFNVIRGCVAGAKKEDLSCDGQTNCNATQCYKAPADIPCNFEVFNINKCYKCDSKSDSNCDAEFTAESYENCKNEAGCYARYKDKVASRGCAENLNDDELTECKKTDNKYCQHCDAPGCNKNKINGSSVIIISNLILISSILINSKFF